MKTEENASDAVVSAALLGADLCGIQQVCYDVLLRRHHGKESCEHELGVAILASKKAVVERIMALKVEISFLERALLTIQPPE